MLWVRPTGYFRGKALVLGGKSSAPKGLEIRKIFYGLSVLNVNSQTPS